MSDAESQTLIRHTPDGQLWVSRNRQRIQLVLGTCAVLVATLGLVSGAYFGATLNGWLGLWMLGGWPAVRRLFRNPRMQLTHWYYVLIDARKFNHRLREDGSVEVTKMRPTLTRGWSWRSVRWYDD